MEINWDAIKYIFQIPKEWYRYVHRKIHNAYGTLFIRVMDGEYGGMKIDIDKQAFKAAVDEAVDLDVSADEVIHPDDCVLRHLETDCPAAGLAEQPLSLFLRKGK